MESPQDNPLKHLGVCLSIQSRQYVQVVQAAERRKRACRERLPPMAEHVEWDWDFSSFDVFGWFSSGSVEERVPDQELVQQDRDDREARDTTDALELFNGLARLQDHRQLFPSLEALARAVRHSNQRCSIALLQRETANLCAQVEQLDLWATLEGFPTQKATGSDTPPERQHGLSSNCSTASTSVRSTGGVCGEGQRAPCSQAMECTSHSRSASDYSLDFSLESTAAAQDAHSWELEFLCSAAAEALWRRLLLDDIRGAEHIVEKVREEVCFHEGRLCGN